MAIAYLLAGLADRGLQTAIDIAVPLPDSEMRVVAHQCASGLNSPVASSVGRLFDAVSVMLGNSPVATYEGQAAAELEAQAHGYGTAGEAYGFELRRESAGVVFDLLPAVREIAQGVRRGDSRAEMAARFHETLAQCTAEVCRQVSEETGLVDVVLCGGVFQNLLLAGRVLELLEEKGLRGHVHDDVPPNDGGLSLGQAAVASALAQE